MSIFDVLCIEFYHATIQLDLLFFTIIVYFKKYVFVASEFYFVYYLFLFYS